MRDVIPKPVFDAIQGHLRDRGAEGNAGWESASEDEDTLTGDFCGSLRTTWREVDSEGGAWRWRVTYKKFRGRGRDAFEKHAGADGIVQVEVHGPGGEVTTKGVLFQAKKNKGSSRSDLADQVRKMEDLAPRGSVVIEFGPEGYRAAAGSIVLQEIETRPNRIPHPDKGVGDYLGDQFLPCESGLRGMYYDAVRKLLTVPSDGTNRTFQILLRHRVRFEIVHESQFEVAGERFRQ